MAEAENFTKIEDQAARNVLKQLRAQMANLQMEKKMPIRQFVEKLSEVSFKWNRFTYNRLETGVIRMNHEYLIPICKVHGITEEQYHKLIDDEIRRLTQHHNIQESGKTNDQIEKELISKSQSIESSMFNEKKHISNIENQQLTELIRGREEDLVWLNNAFFPNGVIAEGKKVAITGIGGMGKTTLALEYAKSNAHLYTYQFFCLASTLDNLTVSYLRIADILKNEDTEIRQCIESDRDSKDYTDNIIRSVRIWLQRAHNYLIIFDNADMIPDVVRKNLASQDVDLETTEWLAAKDSLTETELETFLPSTAFLRGHVLISSRNSIIPEVFGMVDALQLKELLPEAAEAFLMERTQKGDRACLPHEEQEALAQLVKYLYGLPLALEQAGAYIREEDQLFTTYLLSYKLTSADTLREEEHRIKTLERQRPKLGKYALTVATTWLISFGAVEAESKAAAEAFTLSAFLDPEAVPYEILIAASKLVKHGKISALTNLNVHFRSAKNEADIADRYDKLLKPLLRYSLVNKNTHPAQSFKIHRLVQAVRRRSLKESEWVFYYNVFIKSTTALWKR